MNGEAHTGVDEQQPFPGLRSFTEDAQAYFFGRSREAAELIRLVKRDVATVLFGRSGLGKTSLIQAGLFPLLRVDNFLPIPVRLLRRRPERSSGTGQDGDQGTDRGLQDRCTSAHGGPIALGVPFTARRFGTRRIAW